MIIVVYVYSWRIYGSTAPKNLVDDDCEVNSNERYSHESPYCTYEVHQPSLDSNILLSSVALLIVLSIGVVYLDLDGRRGPSDSGQESVLAKDRHGVHQEETNIKN